MEPWDADTHQRKVEILAASPLFERLTRPELSHLAFGADLQTLPQGAVLTRLGQPGVHLYLVAKGTTALVWRADQRPHLVDRDIVGWSALVEPYTYTATATAAGVCEALRLRADAVLGMLAQRTDVGYDVMRSVAAIARARFVEVANQAA